MDLLKQTYLISSLFLNNDAYKLDEATNILSFKGHNNFLGLTKNYYSENYLRKYIFNYPIEDLGRNVTNMLNITENSSLGEHNTTANNNNDSPGQTNIYYAYLIFGLASVVGLGLLCYKFYSYCKQVQNSYKEAAHDEVELSQLDAPEIKIDNNESVLLGNNHEAIEG